MNPLARSRLDIKSKEIQKTAMDLLAVRNEIADENKGELERDFRSIRYSLNEVSKFPRLTNKKVREAVETLRAAGHTFEVNESRGAVKPFQFSVGDVRLIYDVAGIETHGEMKKRLNLSPLAISIAIVNLKGGVGKTTAAVSIATGLIHSKNVICHRLKVLLIDLDPQASASMVFGCVKSISGNGNSAIKAIVKEVTPEILESWIVKTDSEGLDILPASMSDAFFSLDVNQKILSGNLVQINGLLEKHVIEHLSKLYDIILIDCPPSMDLSVTNVLNSVEGMLIPMGLDPLEFDSTLKFLSRLDWLFEVSSPERMDTAKIKIIASKFDENNVIHRDNYDTAMAYFPGMVFNSFVPMTRAFVSTVEKQETIYNIPKKHYSGDPKSLNFARTAMDRVISEIFNRYVTVGSEA